MRYYDSLGLLEPSAYSEAGQRLYTELDFARLQQILTLKRIGLALAEIGHLLTTDPVEVHHLLERQKQVFEKQIRQLELVIQTIEKAQHSIQSGQTLDWEQFVNIIKAVSMSTPSAWLDQFMTGEQQAKLVKQAESQTLDGQKQAGEAWKNLFSDIQQHQDQDVRDPVVQELVERWDNLIDQLAQGDPALAAGLNAAYGQVAALLELDDLPALKDWAQDFQAAALFVQKLRAARKG